MFSTIYTENRFDLLYFTKFKSEKIRSAAAELCGKQSKLNTKDVSPLYKNWFNGFFIWLIRPQKLPISSTIIKLYQQTFKVAIA